MEVTIADDFTIGEYHWNHRVVRRVYNPGTDEEEVEHAIHEAHYEVKGKSSGPCSITTEPVRVYSSEGVAGLRQVLERMLAALDKPVLDYETREEISDE